ncbi:hypothetical protein HPHPA11_0087 [Helicobacter pylori Hp A-11]|uniref:Uncharacterized protein n=3 Tax=Helicobacter pylori TaxID=210 RepID=D7FBS0_HELP3|nr:hypothetical protein HPNQ4053_1607 [Helicobacter pylori NQ4053]EJC10965.1 hypothetical protein HPHPP23_1484 [Helicobacter pylori Hp P-23]EJC52327.1 hypothetical protein HPHPP30_0062 [Helicobacter pylori Hp P-30]ENH58961.1 hypothetical protein HPHPA11_0087 [Helicobacter pylori Hp A-11]CBI65627.1 hypothetical protein predicted by Glimmer/Critica [Helicobacter pylori B8]
MCFKCDLKSKNILNDKEIKKFLKNRSKTHSFKGIGVF